MDQLAEAALARFGLSPQATATLCNVSENHTYRVEDPDSPIGYALRVHRPGYRTPRQIESELEWVDALREDGAVDTPTAVPAPTGERVLHVDDHNVVLWEWLPGSEPDPEGDAVLDGFKRARGGLGADARARARVGAARRLRPPAVGLRPHARRAGPLGPLAGRARDGAGGARAAGAARRDDPGAAARPTGRARSATGSCTPTSASPTCWSTTATCA